MEVAVRGGFTGFTSWRLMAEVVTAARDAFDRLRLRTENPAAARFYERRGFRRCSGRDDCTHIPDLVPDSPGPTDKE
jgi:hypothetical protein